MRDVLKWQGKAKHVASLAIPFLYLAGLFVLSLSSNYFLSIYFYMSVPSSEVLCATIYHVLKQNSWKKHLQFRFMVFLPTKQGLNFVSSILSKKKKPDFINSSKRITICTLNFWGVSYISDCKNLEFGIRGKDQVNVHGMGSQDNKELNEWQNIRKTVSLTQRSGIKDYAVENSALRRAKRNCQLGFWTNWSAHHQPRVQDWLAFCGGKTVPRLSSSANVLSDVRWVGLGPGNTPSTF